jgi:hypothetical protein
MSSLCNVCARMRSRHPCPSNIRNPYQSSNSSQVQIYETLSLCWNVAYLLEDCSRSGLGIPLFALLDREIGVPRHSIIGINRGCPLRGEAYSCTCPRARSSMVNAVPQGEGRRIGGCLPNLTPAPHIDISETYLRIGYNSSQRGSQGFEGSCPTCRGRVFRNRVGKSSSIRRSLWHDLDLSFRCRLGDVSFRFVLFRS